MHGIKPISHTKLPHQENEVEHSKMHVRPISGERQVANILYESGVPYDDTCTFEKNLSNAISRGLIPETGSFILRNLELNLGVGEKMEMPPNIKLINCRVTSGEVSFYSGELHATGRDSIAISKDSNAVAYATVDRAIANASANGAVVTANGYGAIANATVEGAVANASANGAVANAMAPWAIAHAEADGAMACARVAGTSAYATTPGAKAISFDKNAVAFHKQGERYIPADFNYSAEEHIEKMRAQYESFGRDVSGSSGKIFLKNIFDAMKELYQPKNVIGFTQANKETPPTIYYRCGDLAGHATLLHPMKDNIGFEMPYRGDDYSGKNIKDDKHQTRFMEKFPRIGGRHNSRSHLVTVKDNEKLGFHNKAMDAFSGMLALKSMNVERGRTYAMQNLNLLNWTAPGTRAIQR